MSSGDAHSELCVGTLGTGDRILVGSITGLKVNE